MKICHSHLTENHVGRVRRHSHLTHRAHLDTRFPADPLAHGRGHRRRTGMISDVRHYNFLLIDGHNAIHYPYLDS